MDVLSHNRKSATSLNSEPELTHKSGRSPKRRVNLTKAECTKLREFLEHGYELLGRSVAVLSPGDRRRLNGFDPLSFVRARELIKTLEHKLMPGIEPIEAYLDSKKDSTTDRASPRCLINGFEWFQMINDNDCVRHLLSGSSAAMSDVEIRRRGDEPSAIKKHRANDGVIKSQLRSIDEKSASRSNSNEVIVTASQPISTDRISSYRLAALPPIPMLLPREVCAVLARIIAEFLVAQGEFGSRKQASIEKSIASVLDSIGSRSAHRFAQILGDHFDAEASFEAEVDASKKWCEERIEMDSRKPGQVAASKLPIGRTFMTRSIVRRCGYDD